MKKLFMVFVTMFLLSVSTLVYAQAEVGAAIGASLFTLAEALVMPVAGVLSFYAFGGVKKVVALIGKLPANVQRIAVVVQTWVLGLLASALNTTLPETLAALDVGAVETAVASGFAMLLHAVSKKKGG